MKIVSWNVLNKNKKIISELTELMNQDCDVVCLQELSQDGLNFLLSLGNYNVSFVKDFSSKYSSVKDTYLAIISHHEFLKKDGFMLGFDKVTSIWNKYFYRKVKECNFGHFVDICLDDSMYRVVNLHLPVSTGPFVRFGQFKNAMKYLTSMGNNVICGDFNVADFGLINLMTSWLRKYSWKEIFLNERKEIEKLFSKFGFVNIFYRKSTHFLFEKFLLKIQLDHILVENGVEIQEADVLKMRNGSDHRMIYARVGKRS